MLPVSSHIIDYLEDKNIFFNYLNKDRGFLFAEGFLPVKLSYYYMKYVKLICVPNPSFAQIFCNLPLKAA